MEPGRRGKSLIVLLVLSLRSTNTHNLLPFASLQGCWSGERQCSESIAFEDGRGSAVGCAYVGDWTHE